ncbi:MAG: c-type cytochrome [Anaerolineales bacterium]|nr:c-type cytochrome [Anaerolineales bacterium]MCB8950573.1 c-type cytochrome [Ardenticatenales bacterium]
MRKLFLILMLVLAIGLVACGGGDADDAGTSTDSSIGDAKHGEELFASPTIGAASAPGCITCHSLEPGVVIVGPSQADLADRAASRVPGMTAEQYIRQSITEPDAFVVEGFSPGVMYQNYANELSAKDITDLVAYTLTLHNQ